MSEWRSERRTRYDEVTIPAIRVAVALSLVVHALAMWTWLPRMRALSFEDGERGQASGALVAQLVPRDSAPATPPPAPSSAPAHPGPPSTFRRPPPPPAAPPASLPPPVIAARQSAPDSAPPATVQSAAAPPPAPVASGSDLSSYIEARRRSRGAPPPSAAQGNASNAPPAEADIERRNRIVAANLASNPTPTFGYDPRSGGGIFQITRIGSSEAEFIFNGWNKDIGRNIKQRIEVRIGDNADIRIAIARRIIAIIRESETGDFSFLSLRLGYRTTLSARPADNAELEDFMMREFFPGARPPY